MHKKRSRFFRGRQQQQQQQEKKAASVITTDTTATSKEIPGVRRNVYVNQPLSAMEVDSHGEPKVRYVRNKVRTTSKFCFCPFC